MAQLRRTGTLEVGRVRDTDGLVISAAGMLSLFLWLLSLRLIAGRTVRQGRVLAHLLSAAPLEVGRDEQVAGDGRPQRGDEVADVLLALSEDDHAARRKAFDQRPERVDSRPATAGTEGGPDDLADA